MYIQPSYIWPSITIYPRTSATNCARIYNNSYPDLMHPAAWPISLNLDVEDVWNGFFLHSLLLDHAERRVCRFALCFAVWGGSEQSKGCTICRLTQYGFCFAVGDNDAMPQRLPALWPMWLTGFGCSRAKVRFEVRGPRFEVLGSAHLPSGGSDFLPIFHHRYQFRQDCFRYWVIQRRCPQSSSYDDSKTSRALGNCYSNWWIRIETGSGQLYEGLPTTVVCSYLPWPIVMRSSVAVASWEV